MDLPSVSAQLAQQQTELLKAYATKGEHFAQQQTELLGKHVEELAKLVPKYQLLDLTSFGQHQRELLKTYAVQLAKLAPAQQQTSPSIDKILFPDQMVDPGSLAVNCYLVSAGVKPIYVPLDLKHIFNMVSFLDRAQLSVSRLPSGQIIVHRSDRVEMIANLIKNTSKEEGHVAMLSQHDSLMGVRPIPIGENYFLIKFFAEFDGGEHEVAATRILVADFTPQMRLDIVQELNRYKKALSPHFEVFSKFSVPGKNLGDEKQSSNNDLTLGLPAGRF